MNCTLTAMPRKPTILVCGVARENPSMCIWFSHVQTNRELPRMEEMFLDLCPIDRFHLLSDLPRLLWLEMFPKASQDLLIRTSRVPIALPPVAIPTHTCTRCLHLTLTEENTTGSNIHRMATRLGGHHRDLTDTEELLPLDIIPIPLLLTAITVIQGHLISLTWKASLVNLVLLRSEAVERRSVLIQVTTTTTSEDLPLLEAMANDLLLRRVNKISCSRCLSSRQTSHTFITLRLQHLAFLLQGDLPATGCVLQVIPKNFPCSRFLATTAAIVSTTREDGSHPAQRYQRGHSLHTDRRRWVQFFWQDTPLALISSSIFSFLQNIL